VFQKYIGEKDSIDILLTCDKRNKKRRYWSFIILYYKDIEILILRI